MDGRGRWRDNVHIEGLWRTVKYEDIYLQGYENLRSLKRGLASYFNFYNRYRFHQKLDYGTPDQRQRSFQAKNLEEGFNPQKVRQALDTDMVDGAVVLGSALDDDNLEFFAEVSAPIVVYTYRPWLDLDFVDMNNESSVRAALEYLHGAGHRRIGLVKSLAETRNFRAREQAFMETMDRLGLPVSAADCFAIDPTFDKGRQDMAKLLANAGDLPSALFCVNDFIAYGCIQALKDAGLSVPDDVSVVGFDNLPSDEFMEPCLSSVKVSNRAIGRRAMRLLLDRIADPGRPSEKVAIGGELIVHASIRSIDERKQ